MGSAYYLTGPDFVCVIVSEIKPTWPENETPLLLSNDWIGQSNDPLESCHSENAKVWVPKLCYAKVRSDECCTSGQWRLTLIYRYSL